MILIAAVALLFRFETVPRVHYVDDTDARKVLVVSRNDYLVIRSKRDPLIQVFRTTTARYICEIDYGDRRAILKAENPFSVWISDQVSISRSWFRVLTLERK